MAEHSLPATRSRANHNSIPQKLGKWLFHQASNWRTVLGFCLVAALTFISVRFNVELGKLSAVDETSKQLLPMGYGLLDGAALFLSGYVGLKTRSPIRKLIAWVWFGFLLSLSLWAAASFTLSVDERAEHAETYNAIESKRTELETQSKNVELWQTNLSETTLYKTRYTGLLNNEQEKYRKIQSELEALESTLPPAAMAIYRKVAPELNMPPELLAMIVRLLWAAAITLTPIIMALLLAVEFGIITQNTADTPPKGRKFKDWFTRSSKSKVTQLGKGANSPQAPQHGPLPVTASKVKRPKTPKPLGPDRHDTGTDRSKGNRYSKVRQQVISGKLRPSKPAIKKFAECGQSTAEKYLTKMAQEGIIVRQDNGQYRLNNVVPMRQGRAVK